MGRDSNPRYAFDVNTLSRRDRGGLNHNNMSGFHWVDVAIRRDLSARMPPIPAPNGHHNGHRNCLGIMRGFPAPRIGKRTPNQSHDAASRELSAFDDLTAVHGERGSLEDVRRAIARRRRELAG